MPAKKVIVIVSGHGNLLGKGSLCKRDVLCKRLKNGQSWCHDKRFQDLISTKTEHKDVGN